MFGVIKDKLKEYIDTKLQLYQLTIEEKMVNFASILLFIFLIGGLLFVCLVFVLLLLSQIINSITNNPYAGYGIVVSLCLFLLYLLSRKKSITSITERLKKILLSNINK